MRKRILEEKWITDKDEASTGMAVIVILFIIWVLSN